MLIKHVRISLCENERNVWFHIRIDSLFRWHRGRNERSLHLKQQVDVIFSFDRQIVPVVDVIIFAQIQRAKHVFHVNPIFSVGRKTKKIVDRFEIWVFFSHTEENHLDDERSSNSVRFDKSFVLFRLSSSFFQTPVTAEMTKENENEKKISSSINGDSNDSSPFERQIEIDDKTGARSYRDAGGRRRFLCRENSCSTILQRQTDHYCRTYVYHFSRHSSTINKRFHNQMNRSFSLIWLDQFFFLLLIDVFRIFFLLSVTRRFMTL